MGSKLSKLTGLQKQLSDIMDILRHMNHRLDKLEDRAYAPRQNYVSGTLSSLPEHLKKSMETIATIGEANAQQISEKTGRSRAAESDYLNQLVDRGFLRKERVGKEIVFQVFNLHTVCPMCGSQVLITARYCSRCGLALSKDYENLIIPKPRHRAKQSRFSGEP